MLALLVLTVVNISKERWVDDDDDDDLTVSIIQLVGISKQQFMAWEWLSPGITLSNIIIGPGC